MCYVLIIFHTQNNLMNHFDGSPEAIFLFKARGASHMKFDPGDRKKSMGTMSMIMNMFLFSLN